MKQFKLKRVPLYLGLILVLGFYSCSEDSNEIEQTNAIEDTLEIARASEVDVIDVSLGDMVIDIFESQEASEVGRNYPPPLIPECVTLTLVAQQNFRQVTLDFGSEGCLVRGHILRGQIVFSYTRNPQEQEILITYNLLDFFFDAKRVEGERTILRQLANANGNPMYTHSITLSVTWPNGLTAAREGIKVREWVEGFGSGDFSDNVFEVTGNWTTTFVNGNSHTYEVLDPLVRQVTCSYFVSGNFQVQRTNFGGLFDFGNGGCDNQATFTFNNGQVVPITLN